MAAADQYLPVPLAPSAADRIDGDTLERVRRLAEDGTAPNSARAAEADARYLEAWHAARYGRALALPLPVEAVVTFVADHIEGPPAEVDEVLLAERAHPGTGLPWAPKRKPGPHSFATVERRLATLSVMHREAGLDSPTLDYRVRALLTRARRALARRGQRPDKRAAATLEVLRPMLATCAAGTPLDLRDAAMLAVAFASGGRRRSEVVSLMLDDVEARGDDYVVTVWVSKTDQAGVGRTVPVKGEAADALRRWIAFLGAQGVTEGPLFRGLSKSGEVAFRASPDGTPAPLDAKVVARVVKARAALAGLDVAKLSAHSLRSGFLTQSGIDGVDLFSAMGLSGHASVQTAKGYHDAGAALRNRAADLMARPPRQG